MKFDQKELGNRIRAERRKNKLTIEKLCEILDVSPSFIGLVERGASGVSLENLCKLSEIFNVSTDYLLKGEPTGKSEERGSMDILNTHLYSCTDDEIRFLIDMIGFIMPRIQVK